MDQKIVHALRLPSEAAEIGQVTTEYIFVHLITIASPRLPVTSQNARNMAISAESSSKAFNHISITHAKDWSSQDDPANPRNFSLRRRVLSTIAYTLLAFVSTFAASLYGPAIEDVRSEFKVPEEVSILPLSMYNIGMAAGPLIGSPLSETAGRKVVILVTTPIFALFVLGAGFSQSIASLTICRFFAGAFAAPAIGNASATITDYTAGRYRGVVMSFYYTIPTFGAMLGPLIGKSKCVYHTR